MLVPGQLLQLTQKWALRIHVWTPRHGQTLSQSNLYLSQLFNLSLSLYMTKKAILFDGGPPMA